MFNVNNRSYKRLSKEIATRIREAEVYLKERSDKARNPVLGHATDGDFVAEHTTNGSFTQMME